MTKRVVIIACLTLAVAEGAAWAQTTRPGGMLEELDRETQALYAEMQGSVVRVALPPPAWVNELAAKENPLEKWKGQLDEGVRQKLEERVKMAQKGEYHQVNASVTAPKQPTSEPAAVKPTPGETATAGGSVTVLAPVRIGDGVQFRPVTITFSTHIGVVMDEQGHILVPLYVEKEVVGDRKLPVMLADGRTVQAKFVGSDRMMNVTVLQMDQPLGKTVRIAQGRPTDGALVMMMSPNAPVSRLVVWTGGHQEMGLVARMDGAIWGFARFGHFLELDDAKPVVEELVAHGEIKRAQLGVWVQEVPMQDSLRQQVTILSGRPALRVLQVVPGSPAAEAGLKPDDLILTLAGKAVGDTTDFAIAISQSKGPTELKVIHQGHEGSVTVELEPK